MKCAGEILSELITSVETLGAAYEVLYVSDPLRSVLYPSQRELERFLAEGSVGNGPANSTTCDEVCKIKSSLLEGVLVVSSSFGISFVFNYYYPILWNTTINIVVIFLLPFLDRKSVV